MKLGSVLVELSFRKSCQPFTPRCLERHCTELLSSIHSNRGCHRHPPAPAESFTPSAVMPPLPTPTPSPQCLAHLRRLISPSSTPFSPFRQVPVRGRKHSAKGPHTVNIRLLEDIRGYGRKGTYEPTCSPTIPIPRDSHPISPPIPLCCLKINLLMNAELGSIIPVAPGRMRNIYYPQRKAIYVTDGQLRDLNQKDLVVERDFNFGVEQPASPPSSSPNSDAQVVDVRMKLLTVHTTPLVASFAASSLS